MYKIFSRKNNIINRISILVMVGSLSLITNQQSIIAASSTTDIKYAITPQYNSASPFVEGLAYIGNGKFIDKNNEVKVVVPYPEFAEVSDFDNGYSYIGIPGSKDYRNFTVNIINKEGQEVLNTSYNMIDGFYGGLSVAWVYKNGLYGLIDITGKELVKPQYEAYGDSYAFHEGLALVHKNGKYGYIDTTGKVVIKLQYERAYNFREGLAAVKKNGKFGYINKKGSFVIKPQFDSFQASSFSNGIALVSRNNENQFIDKTDKVVAKFPLSYSFRPQNAMENFEVSNEGLISYSVFPQDYKVGLMNKYGKVIVKPKYKSISDFKNGLAQVSELDTPGHRGRVGFINSSGKEVVKPIYYTVSSFHEGLARVSIAVGPYKMKYGFIDTNGKVIIPINLEGASDFNENLASVMINEKWGYIYNPLTYNLE